MTIDEKQQALTNVSREIDRMTAGGGTFQDITKAPGYRAFTLAPPGARMKEEGRTKSGEERDPFGRWLLIQDPKGLRAGLIAAAKSDPKFSKDGSPDDVRDQAKRVRRRGRHVRGPRRRRTGLMRAMSIAPDVAVPACVVQLAEARWVSLASLSRLVGKNASYLQQCVTRGSPKRLGEVERLVLPQFLGVDDRELGACES